MSLSANAVEIVHGTALAVGGRALLIRGASGSGKSDLALRCIAAAPILPGGPRAELVADDQVCIARTAAGIEASPPAPIAGKIEVRGLGIVAVPYCHRAMLEIIVDLVPPQDVPRYPLEALSTEVLGTVLPLLRLTPFEQSAPLKVLLALGRHPEVLTPPGAP